MLIPNTLAPAATILAQSHEQVRGVVDQLVRLEAVVREVNEETGLLVERIGPLGRSPGWGLAPHCSAGPAIRAVIGPSSR